MALKRWAIPAFDLDGGESDTIVLLTAASAKETILLSLLVSNYSAEDDAKIICEHTDGTSTLFKWTIDIPVTNSPFALDSKIVLEPGDVLSFTSNNDDVSIIASGDES